MATNQDYRLLLVTSLPESFDTITELARRYFANVEPLYWEMGNKQTRPQVYEQMEASNFNLIVSHFNGVIFKPHHLEQATFGAVVEALNRFDLAYLHAVEVDMTGKSGDAFDWLKLRNTFDGPYMANGGFERERAEQSVDVGPADLISFGVPFIANPDLPARLALGAPLNKADPETFYGGDARGYTDYPTLKDKAA